MGAEITVRHPTDADVSQIAQLHVASWQATYRGLVPDRVLDDPDFVSMRQRFWTAALTDPAYADNTIAVAEFDGQVVGIAMSGRAMDDDAEWDRQLFVLYTDAEIHGRGAGAALLDTVIDPSIAASLWVADPNPRAQAFYLKHGFAADGAVKIEDDVREIRMVRHVLA